MGSNSDHIEAAFLAWWEQIRGVGANWAESCKFLFSSASCSFTFASLN
jgi:hypothetical protein